MPIQSSYVRAMAAKNRIKFSNHALERMGERKIWLDDVFKAIEHGEVIEIQDRGPGFDIRVLLQEAVGGTPRFYVVATSYPVVEVVSVIEFEEEVWEWRGKIMARRRK